MQILASDLHNPSCHQPYLPVGPTPKVVILVNMTGMTREWGQKPKHQCGHSNPWLCWENVRIFCSLFGRRAPGVRLRQSGHNWTGSSDNGMDDWSMLADQCQWPWSHGRTYKRSLALLSCIFGVSWTWRDCQPSVLWSLIVNFLTKLSQMCGFWKQKLTLGIIFYSISFIPNYGNMAISITISNKLKHTHTHMQQQKHTQKQQHIINTHMHWNYKQQSTDKCMFTLIHSVIAGFC